MTDIEQMIFDILKDVELKEENRKTYGYHGSIKGDLIEYKVYYDIYRHEWTTRNRALEGYLMIKLNPIIYKVIKDNNF